MLDETERLKAEEQGDIQPQASPHPSQSSQSAQSAQPNEDDWAWIETQAYDSIFVDSLKDAESDMMVITREETEGRRRTRQPGEWGWQRLALIIAGLIGFSIFTGASVMAILATYWWLIFIVWAWRNNEFKLTSWPALVIGIFSWIILTSRYNGFDLPPLIALGIIGTGTTIVHYFNVRRGA